MSVINTVNIFILCVCVFLKSCKWLLAGTSLTTRGPWTPLVSERAEKSRLMISFSKAFIVLQEEHSAAVSSLDKIKVNLQRPLPKKKKKNQCKLQ